MADTSEPEPSMDEILASIRRIISEDGRAAPDGQAQDDVLVLTRRVDDQTPTRSQGFMTDEHAQPHTPPAPDDEWVAPTTAGEARSAFDKLSGVAHDRSHDPEPIAMPANGRTLEDVCRELMKPMMKQWLDENLPAIVQERVDEEVERIARRRVR